MTQYDAVTDDIYNFFSEEFDFTNDLIIGEDDNAKEDSDVSEDLTVSSVEQSFKTAQTKKQPIIQHVQVSQVKPKAKTTRKFSDLLKEEEMTKAQSLYDRLISDQIERDKKFTKGEAGIARPITGHVRSVYAQMFMNSVNSADLNNIQNYLGTFMSGPCSFTLHHRVNSMYELPATLTAFSPQLFSHYLLGCFLNFPDMVVKMNGSRMYNAANGHTKIVIDTDVLCTKMFKVKYDWAPDVEHLGNCYSNIRIASSCTGSKDDNKTATEISMETSTNMTNSISSSNNNKKNINNITSTTSSKNNSKHTSNNPTIKQEDEGASGGVIPATPTNLAAVRRLPAIPLTYVTGMSQRACMLPAPVPLHTRGTITLYLDASDCMQHVHVDVTQLDRLSVADPTSTTATTTTTSVGYSSSLSPPTAPASSTTASPSQQKRKKTATKRTSKPNSSE